MPIADIDWAPIQAARAQGLTFKVLSETFGIPEGSIRSRSKRDGWKAQAQKAKLLALKATTSNAATVATKVKERAVERVIKEHRDLAADAQKYKESMSRMIEDGAKVLEENPVATPSEVRSRFQTANSMHTIAKDIYGIGKEEGNKTVVNIGLLSDSPLEVSATVHNESVAADPSP
jgi:hypothetical protein